MSDSSSLQARGAIALVALTLISSLPVAMMYVDVQVMAFLFGDSGVRDRLGGFGQSGAALLWAERPASRAPYRSVKERGSRHALAR